MSNPTKKVSDKVAANINGRHALKVALHLVDKVKGEARARVLDNASEVILDALHSMPLSSTPETMHDHTRELSHKAYCESIALGIAASYQNETPSNASERKAVLEILTKAVSTQHVPTVANLTTAEPIGFGDTDSRKHILRIAERASHVADKTGKHIVSSHSSLVQAIGTGIAKVGGNGDAALSVIVDSTMTTYNDFDGDGFHWTVTGHRTYDMISLAHYASAISYVNNVVNLAQMFLAQLELDRSNWVAANPNKEYPAAQHIINARGIVMTAVSTEIQSKLTKAMLTGTEVACHMVGQMVLAKETVKDVAPSTMVPAYTIDHEQIVYLQDLYPQLFETALGKVPVVETMYAYNSYVSTFDTKEGTTDLPEMDESLDAEAAAFYVYKVGMQAIQPLYGSSEEDTVTQAKVMYENSEIMGNFDGVNPAQDHHQRKH